MKEKRRRQDGERGGKEMRESKEKRREEWRRGESAPLVNTSDGLTGLMDHVCPRFPHF